jgi:hypothetical protein
MTRNLVPYLLGIVALLGGAQAKAQSPSPYRSAEDFNRYAMKLREAALLNVGPQVQIPTTRSTGVSSRYPWKQSIVTTTFWVGESASQNNPVHNRSSSWDIDWHGSFGGFDDPNPANRRGFLPAKFVPRQNPFYYALPYNDVTRGTTKPEAKIAIPWFKQAFEREGKSVCKDRWIAIRKGSRVCYAQWSDCGPFRTDHWQYVFGNERPKPNLNKGAGLDVSPAVRDYLGMAPTDITDWKFVDFRDVPKGPWSQYGDNNHFVQQSRRTNERVVSADPLPTRSSEAPKILTK